MIQPQDEYYNTKDVHLAAFLKMQGYKCQVKKVHGNDGLFVFKREEVSEKVAAFFGSDFELFQNITRNLISQVKNLP